MAKSSHALQPEETAISNAQDGLEATNTSSALDNVLLSLSGLLFVVVCFTVVGIPAVVILLIGAALAVKTGNLANLRVTTRLIQALVVAGGVALAYNAYEYATEATAFNAQLQRQRAEFRYPELLYQSDEELERWCPARDCTEARQLLQYRANASRTRVMALTAKDQSDFYVVLAALSVGLCMALSFCWLGPASRTVGPVRAWLARRGEDADITGRGKTNSFSTADELQKWVKLREDGHITDEEFQRARTRLLSAKR